MLQEMRGILLHVGFKHVTAQKAVLLNSTLALITHMQKDESKFGLAQYCPVVRLQFRESGVFTWPVKSLVASTSASMHWMALMLQVLEEEGAGAGGAEYSACRAVCPTEARPRGPRWGVLHRRQFLSVLACMLPLLLGWPLLIALLLFQAVSCIRWDCPFPDDNESAW